MSPRASRRTNSAEYDAYCRAWTLRQATGDTSAEILLHEWIRIGYAPDEDERELWLDAWASSVRPRRLARFFVRRAGREIVATAREIREIINDPELPEWLTPPPEFRMLSVGFISGDIKKRTIPFAPDPEPSETLDRMRRLPVKKDGHRKVRVWLGPTTDHSRVPVMAGSSRVGWTALDETQLRRLRPRPWTRRTKVADGNLKFRLSAGGELTTGRLKVHLPPAR